MMICGRCKKNTNYCVCGYQGKPAESSESNVKRFVILPCPFCGAEPRVCEQKESVAHPGNYFPEHVECKACGIHITGVKAKERWNKRAPKWDKLPTYSDYFPEDELTI